MGRAKKELLDPASRKTRTTPSRTRLPLVLATPRRKQDIQKASHLDPEPSDVRRYTGVKRIANGQPKKHSLKMTWQQSTILHVRPSDCPESPSAGRGSGQSFSVTQFRQGTLTATLVNHKDLNSGPALRPITGSEIHPLNHSSDNDSVNTIKTHVDNINYLVDNAISSIIEQFKTRIRKFKTVPLDMKILKDIHPEKSPVNDVYSLLSRARDPNRSPCDLLLDVLMHNIMCDKLFENIFQNTYFSGIEPKFAAKLKVVYNKILQEESWVTAQRWRCFTSKHAYFGMKCEEKERENISNLSDEIIGALNELLNRVYCVKKNNFKNMIKAVIAGEEGHISEIVSQAVSLSLKMEHNLASCQMKVTTSPLATHSRASASMQNRYCKFDPSVITAAFADEAKPRNGDAVLGTFKFGLQQITDQETTNVILPTVITSSFIVWCKNMID